MVLKLEKGQEITINVPFRYCIGEKGPITGKLLETVEDCKAEVQAEIDGGISDVFMVVEK